MGILATIESMNARYPYLYGSTGLTACDDFLSLVPYGRIMPRGRR